MADFVLVHGAWQGAWCWRKVLPALSAAGHRVFTVALTGVGERAHLLSKSVTLDTHIADVVGVIRAEELLDAVLVGHSYAGMVITGVADRLHAHLRHLVYLDAMLPRPGESWSSSHPPEVQAARRKAIAEHGTVPAPDPALFGLEGADRAWVARRQTPHPGACYDAVLRFDPAQFAELPRTFIDCNAPALATIATSRERARADAGITVVEIATGHAAMVSAPDALVAELLKLA